jgi:CheY-like chemotaxis protein
MSDPTQLELAILNLGINARDAMASGGELSISTAYIPAETFGPGSMQLCITDSGAGMTDEVRRNAFNPFFTTKDIGAGTGLGLAQVQSIVEQSHGTVRIESTLGVGTQVYLTLPCTDQRQAPADLQVDAGDDAPGQGRRILIIDDDNEVRRVIIDMLEMLGHEVHEADNGRDGLQLLEHVLPDVLLLDFAMPNLNGAEVATAVRLKHRHLPIIFVSGFSDTDQLEAAMGTGVTVLRKPFTLGELRSMIDADGR